MLCVIPYDIGADERSRASAGPTYPAHLLPTDRSQRARLPDSRLLRFAIVGAGSTLGYLALYAVLRFLGLPGQAANAMALLGTGDINTLVNRRWTFRLAGAAPRPDRAKGVVAYLVSLAATSTALALLDLAGLRGSTAELTALLVANALAGVAHYALLRTWAFHQHPVRLPEPT